jgi:hypothetical protein
MCSTQYLLIVIHIYAEILSLFYVYLAPYGVREKCSKLASNDNRRNSLGTNTFSFIYFLMVFFVSYIFSEVYYPSKMKYALNDVFFDLLTLAARLLVIGGRIAYWFPIFSKEY